MTIDHRDLREITDYPEREDTYCVFEVNDRTGEVIDVAMREYIAIDEEYPSMWQGWQDIQEYIEHPEIFGRSHTKYYWAEELKVK